MWTETGWRRPRVEHARAPSATHSLACRARLSGSFAHSPRTPGATSRTLTTRADDDTARSPLTSHRTSSRCRCAAAAAAAAHRRTGPPLQRKLTNGPSALTLLLPNGARLVTLFFFPSLLLARSCYLSLAFPASRQYTYICCDQFWIRLYPFDSRVLLFSLLARDDEVSLSYALPGT